MRIFCSPKSDPMLLDSMKGMRAVYDHLRDFLASPEWATTLEADCTGSPQPYSELLAGLIVEKAKGPIRLTITPNRWLCLSGSPEYLRSYIDDFEFQDNEEGEHHHPGNGAAKDYMAHDSIGLIIEIRTDVIEQLRTA